MMRGWIAVVALVSAVSTGCGSTEPEMDDDELGSTTGAAWGCVLEPTVISGCWQVTCNSDISYQDACDGALQAGTDHCAVHGGVDSRSRLCKWDSTTPPPYRGGYTFCCQ